MMHKRVAIMKSLYLLVTVLVTNVKAGPQVQADYETVWLRDVSSGLQNRRTMVDVDLPGQLTFQLKRASQTLTLNMERNTQINPDADVFFVRVLENGGTIADKATLEKEDLAYYQDKKNSAFMTVKCVRRSSGQCERVINGNVQLEGRNYDLRPAEPNGKSLSRRLLELLGFLDTPYILKDQANVKREIPGGGKEHTKKINLREKRDTELSDIIRGLLSRLEKKEKRKPSRPNADFLIRNVHLPNLRQVTEFKRYYIEVIVLLDFSIWDQYSAMVDYATDSEKDYEVTRQIREAFSHIMNGIDLRYRTIEDPEMEISVHLRQFEIFKEESDFPHYKSQVITRDNVKYIDASDYLDDIIEWNTNTVELPDHDHRMLFTKLVLFSDTIEEGTGTVGLAPMAGICSDQKSSVCESGGYYSTVTTGAHELAHNLGADHDSEDGASDCKAEDQYIMSPNEAELYSGEEYKRNPWMFSPCSIKSMKETLADTTCLANEGVVFDQEEWNEHMLQEPGELYTPDEQCKLIKGPTSGFCGPLTEDICHFMKCIDPVSDDCDDAVNFAAYRGTECALNKWCKEGKCVTWS